MDKISIKELIIYAYHGVNDEEKENGQDFVIDMDYYADLSKACESDDLNHTVNYSKVIKAITKAFTSQSYDLIERAAQVVVDAVFQEFEAIKRIEMTLKKPFAPVNADFDYVSVSIIRER